MKQNHYEHVAEALESICDHLDFDVSGFGIWVAASSIVASAHLAAAFVPLSTL